MTSRPFCVLVVCTANICRSPLAERLLHQRLVERFGARYQSVAVSSAGVRALAGQSMDPPAADVLRDLGGDPDGFFARQLDEGMLRGADLVLTMTREHRAAAVTLTPSALRRTFTLAELARLSAAVPTDDVPPGGAERLGAIAQHAAPLRGTMPPAYAGGDDIDDPHGGPVEGYRAMGRRVADAVDALVATL